MIEKDVAKNTLIKIVFCSPSVLFTYSSQIPYRENTKITAWQIRKFTPITIFFREMNLTSILQLHEKLIKFIEKIRQIVSLQIFNICKQFHEKSIKFIEKFVKLFHYKFSIFVSNFTKNRWNLFNFWSRLQPNSRSCIIWSMIIICYWISMDYLKNYAFIII